MNQVTEQELAAAAVAPRVTLENILDEIVTEHYFTAGEGVIGAFVAGEQAAGRPGVCPTNVDEIKTSLNLLTFCVLVLKNGFTVTGESACASPENFDPEVGRRLARTAAVNKIWPLKGYELRTRLQELRA
jgi:Phage protein (N4 Gp49/phage Sf6 gene 66) family